MKLNKQTNKILALLTFFIALGEISIVTKNLIENPTKIYMITYFSILIIAILIIAIVFLYHNNKKKVHIKETTEKGKAIVEGKMGHILG